MKKKLVKNFKNNKKERRILIVSSIYYEDISNRLINGAKNLIDKMNKSNRVNIKYNIQYAPGSFEIPFIINNNLKFYDGFIALGCIIRGETYHFELIANEVARKIMDLSINSKKPIGFGIITCENINQATKRSSNSSNGNNKGKEAAIACIKTIYDFY